MQCFAPHHPFFCFNLWRRRLLGSCFSLLAWGKYPSFTRETDEQFFNLDSGDSSRHESEFWFFSCYWVWILALSLLDERLWLIIFKMVLILPKRAIVRIIVPVIPCKTVNTVDSTITVIVRLLLSLIFQKEKSSYFCLHTLYKVCLTSEFYSKIAGFLKEVPELFYYSTFF